MRNNESQYKSIKIYKLPYKIMHENPSLGCSTTPSPCFFEFGEPPNSACFQMELGGRGGSLQIITTVLSGLLQHKGTTWIAGIGILNQLPKLRAHFFLLIFFRKLWDGPGPWPKKICLRNEHLNGKISIVCFEANLTNDAKKHEHLKFQVNATSVDVKQ